LKEEANNCRKFLEMQIKCVNPKWIICFGRIASVFLLEEEPETTIGSLRGKTHAFQGRNVICTYHPAYLLRQPAAKKDVWEDLQPAILGLQPN
jgi:DNA polymerase